MDIMEIAALLGKTLKEDDRLKALEAAKEAYTSNAELQKKLVEYEVQQRALQGEITKPERDTAFIDIIQNRIEQLYKEITEDAGKIKIFDEIWSAKSLNAENIKTGTKVKIVRNESLTMFVDLI